MFLTGQPDSVPTALMHNVKHNKILHSRIIIVALTAADTPRVPEAQRGSVRRISDDVSVVRLRFGFMEDPDIPRALARRRLGLELNPLETYLLLVTPVAASGGAVGDAPLAIAAIHLARTAFG